MDMENILYILGAIGGTFGVNKFWPMAQQWLKQVGEERKLKIKMTSSSESDIVDMLKSQLEELKVENKKAQERILHLEITIATLRERYQETALHSRGKKK